MNVTPVHTRIFKEGEDLEAFIVEHIPSIPEGSVLAITSKIVALSEGRTADPKDRVKIIKEESEFALETKHVWLTIKDGTVMASAGVDESNADGKLVLLPKNSFLAAEQIRSKLKKRLKLTNLGIIITDSRTFPLRAGIVGVAHGYAGFKGVRDYRGTKDIFNRKMTFTRTDIADGLATAAVLAMGEGSEQQPLVVIENPPVEFAEAVDRNELHIDIEDDLYRPLFEKMSIIAESIAPMPVEIDYTQGFFLPEEQIVKKQTNGPIMARILRKVAPKIGATVVMEPEWGIVGQINFASGRRRYFRFSSIDLNSLGATEIAKDKAYASFFLKRMGYSTIPGKTFYSAAFGKQIGSDQGIDAAYAYAKKIGFPVIVKPNSASQGRGVALVGSRQNFYRAMRTIFRIDRVALVQTPVRGNDYRVVVLDDKIISAYQRIPLSVIGNGRLTIKELLEQKQREFEKSGRDTKLKFDDPRITTKLIREKLKRASILEKGRRVFLLDNANLSAGGDSIDVTSEMHPDFRKLAISVTRDMGLRLCGVDFMIEGDIRAPLKKYWILEVNAAPGLDHYAANGAVQEQIVEDLYLEVLKSMDS